MHQRQSKKCKISRVEIRLQRPAGRPACQRPRASVHRQPGAVGRVEPALEALDIRRRRAGLRGAVRRLAGSKRARTRE